MAVNEHAIAASEADYAFSALAGFDQLYLAVSGGPDSLALLYLVAEWCARVGVSAPALNVVTVDHGLREESAAEAAMVTQHCAAFGLPHTTLRWGGAKPLSGIPNAARNARYALLEEHARATSGHSRAAVVTAHHQDDQAETFFMRLARGGGVEALAAMPVDRSLIEGSPVRLIRPLLEFSKARLIATLSARGVAWIDDPTNTNHKFERARVRRALEASGLEPAALVTTVRRMQEARDGLSYANQQFRSTLAISYNGGVFGSLERPAFDAGPQILRRTILTEIISKFGGATPKPEMSEIEALVARIQAEKEITATLGGAQISAGELFVRIWREVGRIVEPELKLTSRQRQIWDDRFWVGCTLDAGPTVSVRALGQTGYETISAYVPANLCLPAKAAYGLPAFWADATLFAVPQLAIDTGLFQSLGGLDLISEPIFCDTAAH